MKSASISISTDREGRLANDEEADYQRPVTVTILPSASQARKDLPITTGCFDYFPLALAYVAKISLHGNKKHNPGQPLHWSRAKSTDHADCMGRHLVERGGRDPEDGLLHDGKLAWRALANLQELLERMIADGSSPLI